MAIMGVRSGSPDANPRRAWAAEPGSRDVGYDLMQETSGHYDHVLLDASDNREARRLAWLWHAEHRGQTVVARHDADGRTTIVALLEG